MNSPRDLLSVTAAAPLYVYPCKVLWELLPTGALPASPLPCFPDHQPCCQARHSETESAMKGDKTVIQLLNKQLANELAAINQYFLHARMYKNWGFNALGKHEYEESIEEMQHADKIIERLLFLDGLPKMEVPTLSIGTNVPECLSGDLKLERGAHADLIAGVTHCESVKDYVSRDLMQEILNDTEEHLDYLETQLDLIDKVGLQNYLQTQMGVSGD
jgi:bacterioferritin